MLQTRDIALNNWLSEQLEQSNITLLPLTGDAGFRRYFRFKYKQYSYIAVDAPRAFCNNQAFFDIQAKLKKADIFVPDIICADNEQGFYCLSDLGDTLLADNLSPQTMPDYYQEALSLIPKLAAIKTDGLPSFDDAFVQTELNIFTEWLLGEHLSITLTEQDQLALQSCFDVLKQNIKEQPTVFMHRDFHSRNLMYRSQQLAVIDFQDAVRGPVTYDIVSLLRDCYVRWPNEQVRPLFNDFINKYSATLNVSHIELDTWWRWFELTGVQRHVKAAGIFARLKHRDGKVSFLKEIPLTLSYIIDVTAHYPELNYLHVLVKTRVLPALEALNDHS